MKVYLGLGSNQGDRRRHLRTAVQTMRSWPEFVVTGVSGLYETTYVGPGEQAAYLNACLAADCDLSPGLLLARAQELERAAGRRPSSHFLPRCLDIDILLVGETRVWSDSLVIPHPRMTERRFVLEPLAELDAELRLPGVDASLATLLERAPTRHQRVIRVEDDHWSGEVAA